MNYLHWRCHLSFLDVSPQIMPAKKAWETRLNFPGRLMWVERGVWNNIKRTRKRTRYDTHLSDRDSFLLEQFFTNKIAYILLRFPQLTTVRWATKRKLGLRYTRMLFGRTGGKVVRSNAVKLSVSLRENTALLASVWVKNAGWSQAYAICS